MNANSKLVDPIKGMSTLVRPKFSEGLVLNDDDLTLGVDYTRDLNRLMFRTLFGCGVMCGLVVTVKDECEKLYIQIADGVALDCRGDPIYVPSSQTVILDPKCHVEIPKEIWIALCRHDKCCAPRSTVCGCDDVDTPSVCTRIRDGFEIRVLPARPACACGCAVKGKADPARLEQSGQGTPAAASNPSVPAPPPEPQPTPGVRVEAGCWCVDPNDPCYKHHYAGECACECGEDCDCDCIILARLYQDAKEEWLSDHSVRRFIRPVLMRDPQVYAERTQGDKPKKTTLELAEELDRLAGVAAKLGRQAAAEATKTAADAARAAFEANALAERNENLKAGAAETAKAAKAEAKKKTT
jgi:hypothetical protein